MLEALGGINAWNLLSFQMEGRDANNLLPNISVAGRRPSSALGHYCQFLQNARTFFMLSRRRVRRKPVGGQFGKNEGVNRIGAPFFGLDLRDRRARHGAIGPKLLVSVRARRRFLAKAQRQGDRDKG